MDAAQVKEIEFLLGMSASLRRISNLSPVAAEMRDMAAKIAIARCRILLAKLNASATRDEAAQIRIDFYIVLIGEIIERYSECKKPSAHAHRDHRKATVVGRLRQLLSQRQRK